MHNWLILLWFFWSCSSASDSPNSGPAETSKEGSRPAPKVSSASEAAHHFYDYSESSTNHPVRVGFFMGGRCLHFYRAFLADEFARAGVRVSMHSSYLNDQYRFEEVTKDFDADLIKRVELHFGKVTGVVLSDQITKGVIDGALIGEASLIKAVHDKLPIVAVARMGHSDEELPGMMIVTRKGLKINQATDLRGKNIASRRAGPGDAVLLREWMTQAGMVEGKDFDITVQTNDEDLKSGLNDGSIDASLYHVYGAWRHIVNNGWNLIQRMNWVNPELPAAYLVFHRDFVEQRPDDVVRILRGLGWRITYETQLPKEEYNEVREFNYTLNYVNQGTRLPHTTFPFSIPHHHLEEFQQLMKKHGVMDTTVDLKPHLDGKRFNDPLIAEHKSGKQWPTADLTHMAAEVPKMPDVFAKLPARIDMSIGVDDNLTPGLLLRKLYEAGVSQGMLNNWYPSASMQRLGKSVSAIYPKRFPQRQVEVLQYGKRSWSLRPPASPPQNSAGFSIIRFEPQQEDYSALHSYLKTHNSRPVLWLHGGFATAEGVEQVLQRYDNVYVGLTSSTPDLDVAADHRAQHPVQPWSIKVVKLYTGGGQYIAKVKPKLRTSVDVGWAALAARYSSRLVLASDYFSAIHYETRYRKNIVAFELFLQQLGKPEAARIRHENAARLLKYLDL